MKPRRGNTTFPRRRAAGELPVGVRLTRGRGQGTRPRVTRWRNPSPPEPSFFFFVGVGMHAPPCHGENRRALLGTAICSMKSRAASMRQKQLPGHLRRRERAWRAASLLEIKIVYVSTYSRDGFAPGSILLPLGRQLRQSGPGLAGRGERSLASTKESFVFSPSPLRERTADGTGTWFSSRLPISDPNGAETRRPGGDVASAILRQPLAPPFRAEGRALLLEGSVEAVCRRRTRRSPIDSLEATVGSLGTGCCPLPTDLERTRTAAAPVGSGIPRRLHGEEAGNLVFSALLLAFDCAGDERGVSGNAQASATPVE